MTTMILECNGMSSYIMGRQLNAEFRKLCLQHFPPEGIIRNDPFRCCNTKMTIEDDCCAYCYICGRFMRNVVPSATRDHYLANGGRVRAPYNRLKYYRQWMFGILGDPVYLRDETWERIEDNLEEYTPQDMKRVLRKLKLSKYYKNTSYLLSEITGKKIPKVSDLDKAEQMFCEITGKISYYPNVIYEIFQKINPKHPLLPWIPRRPGAQYAN